MLRSDSGGTQSEMNGSTEGSPLKDVVYGNYALPIDCLTSSLASNSYVPLFALWYLRGRDRVGKICFEPCLQCLRL